eukprot:s3893_g2.t1
MCELAQRVALTEQPHAPQEGEQMPGPERPKAEGKADEADQPTPLAPSRNRAGLDPDSILGCVAVLDELETESRYLRRLLAELNDRCRSLEAALYGSMMEFLCGVQPAETGGSQEK